jgi:hypothetical protein
MTEHESDKAKRLGGHDPVLALAIRQAILDDRPELERLLAPDPEDRRRGRVMVALASGLTALIGLILTWSIWHNGMLGGIPILSGPVLTVFLSIWTTGLAGMGITLILVNGIHRDRF